MEEIENEKTHRKMFYSVLVEESLITRIQSRLESAGYVLDNALFYDWLDDNEEVVVYYEYAGKKRKGIDEEDVRALVAACVLKKRSGGNSKANFLFVKGLGA